ncbi:hypothetical protein N7495_003862 [Penicillium taxi]|uniref:uncharacterized protein n=1 Tax=Penicillium taxi TaxID=168475 RepID=UPI0025454277|nr:uncharacterized protein N7495_003862 [Penicillium taxi]KAJ5899118.1 hypothetical protein N7495_003862 [Penicillium taxi]
MLTHSKSTDQRKVSPPRPSYMSNNQIASYLKDLRTNRPVRPAGSRPYPGKPATSTSLQDLPPRASSAFSMYEPSEDPVLAQPRSGSALSHRRKISNSPEGGPTGCALVQEPRTVSLRKTVSPSQVFSQSVPLPSPSVPSYRENGQRRHEKEEARSLRDALREMDLNDDVRLHHAAQDEATELVWMHQNPGMPLKNPDAPYRNPDVCRDNRNPNMETSFRTRKSSSSSSRKSRQSSSGSSSSETPEPIKRSSMAGSSKKNLKVNFDLPPEESDVTSVPTTRNDSSKGVFRNPDDQIYKDIGETTNEVSGTKPDLSQTGSSTQDKPRNAFTRIPKPLPWLRDRNANGGSVRDKISRFDIHKNPPTQSRNPAYTSNEPTTPPTPSPRVTSIPTKDGIEIRDDDIRAATSKRLKDRSENLPMPSAVSDKFGRPIVSFDPKWRPSDQPKPDRRPQAPSPVSVPVIEVAPSIEVSQPPIPVINVPAIHEPTIAEIAEPSRQQNKSARPQPQPQATSRQNHQVPPRRQPVEPQERWYSPYSRSGVPTAACNSCSLPISGKIVTAGGCRFHPECFTCFNCHTHLECVAFYEEPAASRAEREASNPDGDRVPRFYCHLDFHELFSPRCKSCKTPIEGEIVVACGAEWHVGHFFCAECGDPFNSSTPFVEKDGFAWCLRCHGRRTSSRCVGCKQLVLDDVVISAIGGQWHESCFVCHECGDGFGPDGRFFVREGEPKRTAKGRIIGGPVQLAACERCEGIRLKAPGMC